MNTSQLQSVIRLLLNSASGAILAHTATTANPATKDLVGWLSAFLTGPDALALCMTGVAWLWGHINPADPTTPEKPADPTNTPSLGAGKVIGMILVGFGILAAVSQVGCSSTPQQIAYQSAGTTVVTVDTAMNLWGAYVAAKQPGTNAEQTVKDAYGKYQAAMAALCDAGEIYAATGSTNGVAADNALTQAAFNATHELEDLETLIASFGVNLTP